MVGLGLVWGKGHDQGQVQSRVMEGKSRGRESQRRRGLLADDGERERERGGDWD